MHHISSDPLSFVPSLSKLTMKYQSCLLQDICAGNPPVGFNRAKELVMLKVRPCMTSSWFVCCCVMYPIMVFVFHKQADLNPHIARLMRPTWGPPGSCRPQVGPILAPWTLLSWSLCSYWCVSRNKWLSPMRRHQSSFSCNDYRCETSIFSV